jgi:hypothetical protein
MTRDELNELNALVAENDAITAALANLDAGGLLCAANVGPTADYVAPTPMAMPAPPAMMAMLSPVNVPIRGAVPAGLMTELQNYLTARQAAVQADMAAKGATQDAGGAQSQAAPAAAAQRVPPQRPVAQPVQRPQPPQR